MGVKFQDASPTPRGQNSPNLSKHFRPMVLTKLRWKLLKCKFAIFDDFLIHRFPIWRNQDGCYHGYLGNGVPVTSYRIMSFWGHLMHVRFFRK